LIRSVVTLYPQEDMVVLTDIIVCERFVKLHTCECKLNHENDLRDHSNFNCLNKIDESRREIVVIKNVYSTGIISDCMVH